MPTTITVIDCDDGRRVSAHVGDTIEVRLAENATAGYRWVIDDGERCGALELSEADAAYPGGTTGCAGEARFRFAVRAAGTSTLRLKYWRHWEGDAGVRRRFTVDVDITPG